MASAEGDHTYQYTGNEDHKGDRIALVVGKWHAEITQELYRGAIAILEANGVEFTLKQEVPGAYELPLAAKWLADSRRFDAIICLGVVVKGETRHDEYINHAVARSLMKVSLKHKLPVIYGVLTTENLQQAYARAGGEAGHKGKECGVAALEMIDLMRATKNL